MKSSLQMPAVELFHANTNLTSQWLSPEIFFLPLTLYFFKCKNSLLHCGLIRSWILTFLTITFTLSTELNIRTYWSFSLTDNLSFSPISTWSLFLPLTPLKEYFNLHTHTHTQTVSRTGCSQVFKANFLSPPSPPGLKGSNRTSHLGNKHHPVFAEQTMVPFQPVPGRQAKGQPSNSGPDRSVNILHSFSARKSSSVLKMKCSQTCERLARNHRQSK